MQGMQSTTKEVLTISKRMFHHKVCIYPNIMYDNIYIYIYHMYNDAPNHTDEDSFEY